MKTPPHIGSWILSITNRKRNRETVLGDFTELYNEIYSEHGRVYAYLWFYSQSLRSIPRFIFTSFYWGFIMIGNYLKITFRTVLKYKTFSSINIFGFAISISICLMIIIFINDQKSSDRFNEKGDRIVRVYTTDKDIKYSEVRGYASTTGSLAPYLEANYPFIEDVVRLRQNRGSVLYKGTAISIGGLYAEPSFFNIFSYQLKAGNPQTALSEPYSIILSEETAHKFFGNDDPINKKLSLEKLGDFTVTGVLPDLEMKSHLRFDALFSFSTVSSLENSGVLDSDMNSWSSFEKYYTYVLLENEGDQSIFKEYLTEIGDVIFPEPENERYGFEIQPIFEINLGINLWYPMPGTVKSSELIFIPILAVLIIFIACFNYIILSIAHSLKRTKEIGLHKIIGAGRRHIIKLFLSEAFVITSFALISACLLILLLIPVFNGLDLIENSKLKINIQQMKDPDLYVIFILFGIGVSIMAGLIPALYLSSFKPVNALKGISKTKGLSHLPMSKILMGIQFAASLIFIIFILHFKQLHTYLTTLDYGIETENLVNVYLREVNYELFKNEIITNSNINGVSLSSEVPVYGGQRVLDLRTESIEKPRPTFYYSVDPEFINIFDIELIAGRNFSTEFSTDTKNAVIINREAVRVFNLGSPGESIGKTLLTGDDCEVRVIGVAKNFIYYFPDEPIAPLVLQYKPGEFEFASISYTPGTKDEIKAYLQEVWKKFDKVNDVSYQFFDDAKRDSDNEMSGIIAIFSWAAGFVVLIALLGLLGMALYSTEMRIKEIGIRKVLGASVFNATYLLSKDYVNMILYSAAFAIPGGYFLSDSFFQFFAFRPDLNLWVLPCALFFVLILALITISSQTVKAALTNPAETLKEE